MGVSIQSYVVGDRLAGCRVPVTGSWRGRWGRRLRIWVLAKVLRTLRPRGKELRSYLREHRIGQDVFVCAVATLLPNGLGAQFLPLRFQQVRGSNVDRFLLCMCRCLLDRSEEH